MHLLLMLIFLHWLPQLVPQEHALRPLLLHTSARECCILRSRVGLTRRRFNPLPHDGHSRSGNRGSLEEVPAVREGDGEEGGLHRRLREKQVGRVAYQVLALLVLPTRWIRIT